MKVAFHLRKRRGAAPADALLLTSHDPATLLDLCARLGADPLPRLHVTADGFLLHLAAPVSGTFPQTIRLRSLCPNLLLPVEADLVPALHDDEARALVRDRGVVFLPGGRALAYASAQPVSIASLLNAGSVERQTWQRFLVGRRLADRIDAIVLDLPSPPAEEILSAGQPDVASEEPRPPESGVIDTLKGKAAAGAGHGLIGLGKLLGLKGLAQLGAQMVQRAVEQAPRLSESVLGRQEAALRELLRQFRAGDLEQALRRALPLGGPGGRGGIAATDARLPTHSLTYSLTSLLDSGGGRASIWLGGYDVQAELAKEYRKAAESAEQRGDYRRAAFIYGRLLQDYRRAADVLYHGGLYHDAALIYLNKLDDRRAAARAFAAAHEIDRAVALYRQLGEHVEAGDLLRRAGEEAAALAEYRIAADHMAGAENWHAAGELLLNRGRRPDLAQMHWEQGWQRRPSEKSFPCAFALARLHADRADAPPLRKLMTEARELFDPAGNDATAGQFYNVVAELAERPGLRAARDELRDQTLMGLARKLQQRVASETRPGDLVSSLLGRAGTWPAALVSDAQFAVRAALKEPMHKAEAPTVTEVRLGAGVVTAACSATLTGDVFIGFASGMVACFKARASDGMSVLTGDAWPVTSLAASADGQYLAVLHGGGESDGSLSVYRRRPDGLYALNSCRPGELRAEATLAPQIAELGGDYFIGLWDGKRFIRLRAGTLHPTATIPYELSGGSYAAALLTGPRDFLPNEPGICFLNDNELLWRRAVDGVDAHSPIVLGWTPKIPRDNSLKSVPVGWLQNGEILELAGLSEEGALHWSCLLKGSMGPVLTGNNTVEPVGGCKAATIVAPGLVAAVTAEQIIWLRAGRNFMQQGTTDVTIPGAVACFVSHTTRELLVARGDGVVERVPLPAIV